MAGRDAEPSAPGAPAPAEAGPEPAPPDSGDTRSAGGPWVLAPGGTATLSLPVPDAQAVRVLRVEVGEVQNPGGQNFVLVVTALLPSGGVELARLAFYPTNQGGTFVSRLPDAVAAHAVERRSLSLRLTLEGAPEVPAQNGARVQVRRITLLPEPT